MDIEGRRIFLFGVTLTEIIILLFFILMLLSANIITDKNKEILQQKELIESLNNISDDDFKQLEQITELVLPDESEILVDSDEPFKKLVEVKEKIVKLIEENKKTKRESNELKNQNKYLRIKTEGHGPPPCWVNPKGKEEYLFRIILKNGIYIIEKDWPEHRQADAMALPSVNEMVGKSFDRNSFRKLALPIKKNGVENECVHYVVRADHVENDKPTYKFMMRTMNDYFYSYNEQGQVTSRYNRDNWNWRDEDGDCQNTRAEILIKKNMSKSALKFKTPKKCLVTEGKWFDPYSGTEFYNASNLDIDHIVPLKWAYLHGADLWSQSKKRKFANDPQNLLPVSKRLNRSKGAKGPDKWLPKNQEFKCEYHKAFDDVVKKYDLTYTPEEDTSIEVVSMLCDLSRSITE